MTVSCRDQSSETRKERPEDTEPGDDDSRPVDLRLEWGSRCVGRVKQPQCCPDDRKQAAKCGDKRPASIAVGRRRTRLRARRKPSGVVSITTAANIAPSAPRKRPTSPGFSRSVVTDPKTARMQASRGSRTNCHPRRPNHRTLCRGRLQRSAAAREASTLLPFDQVRNSVDTSATTAPDCAGSMRHDSVAVTRAKLPAWSDLAPWPWPPVPPRRAGRAASIGERSVESSEQVHAIGCLGPANAVQNNSHGERGKGGGAAKGDVEVVCRSEDGKAEAACAHQRGDTEHRNRQQERLVEAGHDGRAGQWKLNIKENSPPGAP